MYFNDKKENTNIDNEFNNKKKFNFNFNKFKLPLIIIGIIILLVGMILIFISLNNGKEKEKKYYIFLTGEDTITIYKGDVYNEPGYSATDNLHNDLTNDVVIDNQVDTNTIGNYQITYTLNGVIKTRYVNVIKKPIGATLLYLKGSLNIYLKVGEKYIEPGYVAIDTVDSSLVDKVKINNQVDTSKAGTYRIIYSVVNSSGVTTSAIRTVIVLDSELNLNVSTNSYTNKNIKIYVNVLDNYFDYLLLPNGNKVTKSTYEYEVTKNGTYKFISYSKKGDTKEESITVSNIDKTSPTGSCSGSYKDNISTINISASDNVGVSKYVINGVSYTSKKITVNKAMEKANITIYDKAGNTKSISCKLKQLDDPIYSKEKYHQNSINNIRYILYNQTDPRWNDVKFSPDRTIGSVGCAITAVSVISSAYDTSITPKTVFDIYPYNHPYESITNLSNNKFKCEMLNTLNTKTKIINSLSRGNVIVIMVKGHYDGGSSKFTSSQHYMALIDYDKNNNKIFVGNSYGTYGYSQSGWYNEDEVLTSVRQIHECIPNQTLINKFN